MIFAKSTLYGLDAEIYKMQESLNNELAWFNNVGDSDIAIYGKIQPTTNSNGNLIPECYNQTSNDYEQIFIDDRLAGTIGFRVLDRNINSGLTTANIDVIFTVLLTEIHGNKLREEERALLEAKKVIEIDAEILDIKEHIPEVFSGFDNSQIQWRDMSKWYVFALNIEIPYNNNLCTPLEL